jgi:hypothetical protein
MHLHEPHPRHLDRGLGRPPPPLRREIHRAGLMSPIEVQAILPDLGTNSLFPHQRCPRRAMMALRVPEWAGPRFHSLHQTRLRVPGQRRAELPQGCPA